MAGAKFAVDKGLSAADAMRNRKAVESRIIKLD
jgi:hypothetical protein